MNGAKTDYREISVSIAIEKGACGRNSCFVFDLVYVCDYKGYEKVQILVESKVGVIIVIYDRFFVAYCDFPFNSHFGITYFVLS